LQGGAMRLELIDHARARRAKDADENVCVFQIGGHVHLINAHETMFKIHLARDESTELAFEHFIYAQ